MGHLPAIMIVGLLGSCLVLMIELRLEYITRFGVHVNHCQYYVMWLCVCYTSNHFGCRLFTMIVASFGVEMRRPGQLADCYCFSCSSNGRRSRRHRHLHLHWLSTCQHYRYQKPCSPIVCIASISTDSKQDHILTRNILPHYEWKQSGRKR